MFDYLQQFNSLPKDLRDKVSSPEAMSLLTEIENKYGVDLAMVVMRVMIKTLAIKDMVAFFVSEFALAPLQAENLAKELKEKIFSPVADYVGLVSEKRVLDLYQDINALIKEAGLVIPSEFLVERLTKILATYLRGVRGRIDTREALAKDANSGGLGLSAAEIDRVLKVCDSQRFKYDGSTPPSNPNLALATAAPTALMPMKRLEEIMASSDGARNTVSKPAAEYDLKRALASGETKRIVAASDEATNIVAAPDETKSVVAKTVPTDKPAAIPVSAPKPPIVHKPENNGLFRKLFTESQKTATPGAIKFATIAGQAAATSVASPVIVADAATTKPAAAAISKSAPAAPESPIINAKPASVPAVKPVPGARSNVTPAINRPSNVESARPRLQDVKPMPRTMGPLEELQFLDLVNFRRLGASPEEITMKILNKIRLLEKDGYEKMIAGIAAWKRSPVCRLYLHLAQEAILTGKPFQEMVTAKSQQDSNVLRWEEIEAIINLNSKLVF